jgi:molecular chaperone DnaK (HSP70)
MGGRPGARGILNDVQGQWQVAIDFGTSNAIVVLGGPNAWTQPVPFDGGPLLQAGVFAAENGQLLTGRDAEQGALRAPGRYEPHPKRRIDEGTVLLGDREFDVSWLIGAVLGRAYAEACRISRTRVAGVVLPCPVGWGQRRRAVLTAAAGVARLPAPRLVPEPVAAAAHFVGAHGVVVPQGRCVLVYDLGGGTFEATVLRRTAAGFDVVATEGLDDVGGNDIDAAIVTYLREQVRPDDGAWRQLTQPESTMELHAARALWSGVRAAKERLSRSSSTVVSVPLLGVDAPLGREQFEDMARPILERTIAVVSSVLVAARVNPTDLAAVLPVDGSSRIPLVTTLLHRTLGVAPTSIEAATPRGGASAASPSPRRPGRPARSSRRPRRRTA